MLDSIKCYSQSSRFEREIKIHCVFAEKVITAFLMIMDEGALYNGSSNSVTDSNDVQNVIITL
jgi:hypothetical protein